MATSRVGRPAVWPGRLALLRKKRQRWHKLVKVKSRQSAHTTTYSVRTRYAVGDRYEFQPKVDHEGQVWLMGRYK